METISFFFLIEAIGTIAFASSGAMTAIRKRLDLLGVIILGNNRRRRRYAQRHSSWKGASQPVHQPDLCDHGLCYRAGSFFIIRFNQHILTGPYIVIYERIMNILTPSAGCLYGHRHRHRHDGRLWRLSFPVYLSGSSYRSRRRRSQRYHGRTDALYPESMYAVHL